MNTKDKKISYKYNIFKLLSVSILLVSVTFCWFILTKEASVDSISVEVTTVLSVSISDSEDGEYGNRVEIEDDNLTVTEFSGNGKTLYTPIIAKNTVNGYYLYHESLNYNKVEKDYIELTTYIKTDGPICLYLSPNSSISPKSDNEFLDNIAGAIRVGIISQGENPFIWAPNSTYEYNPIDGTVNKNGTPEAEYTYVDGSSESEFLDADKLVRIQNLDLKADGVSDDKKFVWGNLNNIENYLDSVAPVMVTDKNLNKETIIPVTIRIWIEGTDREAVKTLIGGKFNVNITFLATDYK